MSKNKKSILFIAPEFFKFHVLIQDELKRQGYEVYFAPDRPSKKALVKILIRKARFLLAPYIWRHYTSLFAEIPADLDEVFIIKGESFSRALVREMRRRFPRARFQVYLWDSLNNSKSAVAWRDLMDHVWTFDFEDAKADPSLKLLPNFAIEIASSSQLREWRAKPVLWNLAFFGTVHTDRLKILDAIRLPAGFKFYRFLFFQSPLLYYFRKFFDPNFKRFSPDEMSLTPKLESDWSSIAESTVAILDIHHAGQTGLTHRTMECLGMGMKLVTTNSTIREYPFYDPRLIQIIDRNNPVIDAEFLRSRSDVEPPAALRDVDLEHWVRTILG